MVQCQGIHTKWPLRCCPLGRGSHRWQQRHSGEWCPCYHLEKMISDKRSIIMVNSDYYIIIGGWYREMKDERILWNCSGDPNNIIVNSEKIILAMMHFCFNIRYCVLWHIKLCPVFTIPIDYTSSVSQITSQIVLLTNTFVWCHHHHDNLAMAVLILCITWGYQ